MTASSDRARPGGGKRWADMPILTVEKERDKMLYGPCLPDGEGHHECVGRDEVGLPLCQCTCHKGVVVTHAARPRDDAPRLVRALEEIAILNEDADLMIAIAVANSAIDRGMANPDGNVISIDEPRICPTCDAGDPTSVIPLADCECKN